MYQERRKRKIILDEATIRAANNLGEVVAQDQDFLDVLQEIDQDDFINKRCVRVDLDFIARKYDGFLDAVLRKRSKSTQSASPRSQNDTEVSLAEARERANERNLATLARLRAARARMEAEKGENSPQQSPDHRLFVASR